MSIRKRDIRVFVLGLLTAIVIEFFWNWDQNIQAMKDGYRDGYNAGKIESEN